MDVWQRQIAGSHTQIQLVRMPFVIKLLTDNAESEIGNITVVSDGRSLCAVDFGDPNDRLLPLLTRRFGTEISLVEANDPQGFLSAIEAYLDGDCSAVDALPTNAGGTPFQQAVWRALLEIPAGETESYGTLAIRLGTPNAARAVGLANGRNPINIVVPCHRVIGANGALTGYGGGIERKRWLLDHESNCA